MRKDGYKINKSSFLSIDKDLNTILNYILENQNLKKLLYYNTKDCLTKTDLTPLETSELFGKNIKIVPKVYTEGEMISYVIINFDNFTPNYSNPEFRDNIIELDIICPFELWQLDNLQLRPYRIAAELDSYLDGAHLSGIGTLDFLGAKLLIFPDDTAGLCLMYQAIHGEEDKVNPLS